MAGLAFELVSPERVLFSGDVDAVVLPASEGSLTVLAERALPEEEITQEALDHEILQAEMAYDATNDHAAKQAADAAIAPLREAKAALNY